MILETAVEALPGEPASSTASVWRKGSCHQLGELRSSWKSIHVSHLQTVLEVNCRFSDDLAIPELGRAAPCGVYDLAGNTGWVGVGVDHDTASFAVETIRRWWCAMGQEKYPRASRLLITVDGGGSNGSRVRLWKLELQRLADETAWPSRSVTFHPVRASGTRSTTA